MKTFKMHKVLYMPNACNFFFEISYHRVIIEFLLVIKIYIYTCSMH